MKLAVLDFEMNQPSGKLIQLGAVCLDLRSGKITGYFNSYCNPNELLSPRIVELTGIDQTTVDCGVGESQMLLDFWNWYKKESCSGAVSWGSDNKILLRQSILHKVQVPRLKIDLDLKSAISIARAAFPNGKIRGGLKSSLTIFDLAFDGAQHNALHDAYNTAKLVFLIKEVFFSYVKTRLKSAKSVTSFNKVFNT